MYLFICLCLLYWGLIVRSNRCACVYVSLCMFVISVCCLYVSVIPLHPQAGLLSLSKKQLHQLVIIKICSGNSYLKWKLKTLDHFFGKFVLHFYLRNSVCCMNKCIKTWPAFTYMWNYKFLISSPIFKMSLNHSGWNPWPVTEESFLTYNFIPQKSIWLVFLETFYCRVTLNCNWMRFFVPCALTRKILPRPTPTPFFTASC